MVTVPVLRSSLRLPRCTSSAWPGALRQLRWMPLQDSHSSIGFRSRCRASSLLMGGCLGGVRGAGALLYATQATQKLVQGITGVHRPLVLGLHVVVGEDVEV